MPFWTYMLHCRGGAFYTGHTDDLERITQHKIGAIPGFTADRLPVKLVWSEEFSTRQEAFEAERRIKEWSRAKKLALIGEAWPRIYELAKRKEGPSTSSGRAGAEDRDEILAGALEQAGRIDKAMAEASGLSRERIKALIAEGRVLVEGVPATSPSAKITAGSAFAIHLPPLANPQAYPQDMHLDVVYEDQHLIVVDKPAGMVVHPAAGNREGTLVNALLHHCKGQLSGIGGVARPGIVHRIDKDTSGLLVVAKSDAAHRGLARQFADHSLERTYLAVVSGHPSPPAGTIEGRLGRSETNRKKMAVLPKNSSRGKHAVTHYKVIQALEGCSLVECRLETGRTHQVRVHLSAIGHPLLGDPVYGRVNPRLRPVLDRLGFRRQALHAAVLGFIHPLTGTALRFASELPADMRELIDETGHSDR